MGLLFWKRLSLDVQYMSDLHFETQNYQVSIKRVAPTLLLVGDSERSCDTGKYTTFLYQCCESFRRDLSIAGNHELYNTSYEESLQLVESNTKTRPA